MDKKTRDILSGLKDDVGEIEDLIEAGHGGAAYQVAARIEYAGFELMEMLKDSENE